MFQPAFSLTLCRMAGGRAAFCWCPGPDLVPPFFGGGRGGVGRCLLQAGPNSRDSWLHSGVLFGAEAVPFPPSWHRLYSFGSMSLATEHPESSWGKRPPPKKSELEAAENTAKAQPQVRDSGVYLCVCECVRGMGITHPRRNANTRLGDRQSGPDRGIPKCALYKSALTNSVQCRPQTHSWLKDQTRNL